MKALIVLAFLLVPQIAAADEPEDIVYKRHTVHSFGDDTIDGRLDSPDGKVLTSRLGQIHDSLIKLRPSFHKEILRTVR